MTNRTIAIIKQLLLTYSTPILAISCFTAIILLYEALVLTVRYTFYYWPYHFNISYQDNFCLATTAPFRTVGCFIELNAVCLFLFTFVALVLFIIVSAIYFIVIGCYQCVAECRRNYQLAQQTVDVELNN